MLEDMLRASSLNFGGNWDKQVPLMEFAYNNSYQSNLNMAPFEALYVGDVELLFVRMKQEKGSC